ncbi:MAG: DHA2 family efflux MFS transporter permease subunit [Vulcanimicrobiaceae bacterium]
MSTTMKHDESLVEFGTRRWLVVAGVMLATLLQVLDSTIVNVALPTIQGNLGANFDEGAWIVTGYIIAAVIVIPLTPWLQQVFGRRQYYVGAIIGFTVASALCGLSHSLDELLFFRILQGFCGGGLISTGQAIMRDTFPAKELGKSQALVSIGAIVGPSIGPTLGGVLTDALSWNWIFYINIIPGITAAIICAMMLRNPPREGKPSLDGAGLLFMALGLGCLQYVLDEGERYGWLGSERIRLFSFVAVAALALFVYWELRVAKRPIVDLRILKNRTVASGCLLALALAFSLFGGVILAPQFQQRLLGFTPTLSGESILVRALAIAAMTPITLFLLNRLRVSPKLLLGIGFAIAGIANIAFAHVVTTQSDFWSFVPALALGGIGLGMIFVPISVVVLTSVHGLATQKATSLLSLCQLLGGSISTATMVTLLDRRSAFHLSMLAGAINWRRPAVFEALQRASPSALFGLVSQQAVTMAFADAFFVLGVVTLILTPLVLILKVPRSLHGAVPMAIAD